MLIGYSWNLKRWVLCRLLRGQLIIPGGLIPSRSALLGFVPNGLRRRMDSRAGSQGRWYCFFVSGSGLRFLQNRVDGAGSSGDFSLKSQLFLGALCPEGVAVVLLLPKRKPKMVPIWTALVLCPTLAGWSVGSRNWMTTGLSSFFFFFKQNTKMLKASFVLLCACGIILLLRKQIKETCILCYHRMKRVSNHHIPKFFYFLVWEHTRRHGSSNRNSFSSLTCSWPWAGRQTADLSSTRRAWEPGISSPAGEEGVGVDALDAGL